MALPPQIKDPLKLCACVYALWDKHRDILWDEYKIHTALIETLRDPARQAYYVKKGVSKTMKSFHLPQPPKGLALAYDLVPASLLTEPNWDPGSSLWTTSGKVGMSLGLEWGFHMWGWDKPHFQLSKCVCKD